MKIAFLKHKSNPEELIEIRNTPEDEFERILEQMKVILNILLIFF